MARFIFILGLLVVLAMLLVLAAQLGLLAGQPPRDLGVKDGRLKPPSRTPNSVSSQADLHPDHPQRDYARIDPLPAGLPSAPLAPVKAVIERMPEARIVEDRPDYLRVEFTTRVLRFVDDAEFWFDPVLGMVQVRSASRLGRKDFGVNRARIEAIRGQLGGQRITG